MALGSLSAPRSYIAAITPQPVGELYSQAHLSAWMAEGLARIHGLSDPDAQQARALFHRLGRGATIASRRSVLPDFASDAPSQWTLFRPSGANPWYRPAMEDRMGLFASVARAAADRAFPEHEPAPGAAVQVTCTGYEAPTALQRLAAARGWDQRTRLLQLGHMGCFAAVPALALAADLAEACGRVALLHVELCTLHLALEAREADQVVIHHLFSDGAIRYDVTGRPSDATTFAVVDSFEVVLPETTEDMTWKLTAGGFRMTLARHVPAAVARALPGVVSEFLGRHGLYRGDIDCYAIHPGGTRIIDGVAQCLELPEAKIGLSRAVLKERGNMSSATLPHIWDAAARDATLPDGALVMSLAFGPGLTITGNLLRKGA